MGMSSVTASPAFHSRRISQNFSPGKTSRAGSSLTVSFALGHQRGMRSRNGNSAASDGVTTIFTRPDVG